MVSTRLLISKSSSPCDTPSREPIGQESHVICAHNYFRTFYLIPRIIADNIARIAYIYSLLPKTHSLTFWPPETALSLFLSSFRLPETAWPCHLVRYNSIRVTWVRIHSATFFFPALPFRLDFFQSRTQPQKFRQIPKETNNQYGRRHVPPRIQYYISVHWYITWNT